MTTGNRLNLHTLAEREKRNKTVFTSVRCEIIYDILEVENEIETKVAENSYRLLSVKKIGTLMNEKLCCSCIVTDTVDDFVEYCCNVDNDFKKLRETKSKYKQSKKKCSLSVNEKCIVLQQHLKFAAQVVHLHVLQKLQILLSK